jgi:FkbM family methyltransferase
MTLALTSVRHAAVAAAKKVGKPIAARWPFPVTVRLKTGRRMYVDLRSTIGQGLFVKGEFDPAVFEPIAAALSPGGAFIDVGANVGYYSMRAIDIVGERGHVHAFEIDPRPLACLRRTVRKFDLSNIHVHSVALGSSAGTVYLTKESECGNSYVATTGAGIEVPMISFDEWISSQSIASIDAMKIDVEGFEYEVLRGAAKSLQRFRPVLVIEADDQLQARNGSNTADIERLLAEMGYTTSVVANCWSPTVVATAIKH